MAISTGEPLGTGGIYMGIPRFGFSRAESGDAAFLQVVITGDGSCQQPCRSL